MADTQTITMEWVLSFSQAKGAFEQLVEASLRKPEVLEILKSNLLHSDRRAVPLDSSIQVVF